jgi:multidrug efflux pump subunit AcrA (membrane-fusion protein)
MKRFNKFKKIFREKITVLNKKRVVVTKKTFVYIQKKPFTSFFAVLGLFLVLMIIGNLLFSPKVKNTDEKVAAKKVNVYKLGSAPTLTYEGKVEKSGVVKIVAQMPGIVNSVNVYEGQEIGKGTTLISLATNYQGGNALSIARQIAQTQYQSSKDTFDEQKDLIAKQKENADKNKDNADALRQITTQSATDTQALFDLNTTIVNSMSQNIKNLENANVGGANDAAILQSKQLLSQFQSAMNQTSSAYKNLQIQSSDASNAIANNSYSIALKQLDLQQKALETGLQVSRLSYNMALVNEANMYPSAPFGGTVDKIFVKVGENVQGGTLLTSISGFDQHSEIVVNVPENVAKNISAFEPSILTIGDKEISMMPTYVSKDATNGVLYSVIYQLDNSFSSKLTNLSFVKVKLAIGVADTTNLDPFIPLDSVIQTQEESYVYIVDEKNIAKVKKIKLGQIQGRYVEVLEGLPNDAQVILDRNVIEGDKVSVIR